ncbi:uncharacterized protein LOC125779490 [Bactrocera dorsalis]|uniref:Uncharacterized protein LOC125779490 n=1 Tax=Bactrocera dorsalis TaxID=27457 RepID=A0ABM3K5Q2_BACDO|nr:uncharacterized protein LOC125779490 [Bactrocera dorsalis]
MSILNIKRSTFSIQPMSQYSDETSCCPGCSSLKENIEQQFKQMNNTIQKLQETIVNQNGIIMKSLAEQKVLTERVLHQEVSNNNVRAVFPIKSVNDLHDFNTIISEDNRDLYVNRMKALLKGRLAKTLTDVISQSVCIEVNLDGVHGKKRLKDFKAFYQTLMDACRSLGFEDNEKEIRNALKIIKKRHFHAECLKNKKNKTEN